TWPRLMQHNQHIAELGPLLTRCGVRHVVICPGSRNAPLTQLFTSGDPFYAYSIVDERSAGYVALGMSRQLGEPVGVVTTSGTAVLNLAPAVAEAYHQRIPLVVLTADRPLEEIPQFNNQWLDQEAPYYSFSKGFYQLPLEVYHTEDLERMLVHVERLISSAVTPPDGPVHLNVPLAEPLYKKLPMPTLNKGGAVNHEDPGETDLSDPGPVPADSKILVLAGMGAHDEALQKSLVHLTERRHTVVVAENITNLPGEGFIAHPDLLLAGTSKQIRETLVPDLVISFGGQVVSKRLKLFLQSPGGPDHVEIAGDVVSFLDQLAGQNVAGGGFSNSYLNSWKSAEERIMALAREKLENLPFGNLSAIHMIVSRVPSGTVMHLGNSATIRYSQLTPMRKDLLYYSNRGTSGIDGCVSSAVGAALVSEKMHLLVLGDLSFVYDSNALWNKDFPDNLKIVVMND
ncbi:MAG: 2-succinyl-5-enolpyruvyl-6-hydroxy-3-cyclohexene-1-carboxylic-acid synthase, partial [Bacteroidales bacterium]|nr:2-succinyl-5-enolpyruvyl-6-hydroxy-3-cyclohexene-1-carboxylic-acid synthase [Bacteroidales bacterium]